MIKMPAPPAYAKAFTAVTEHVRSDIIVSALQRREWAFFSQTRQHSRHLILLKTGKGEIHHADHTQALGSPSVTWLSVTEPFTLDLRAGSTGHILSLSDDMLESSIGTNPEATTLRHITGQSITITPEDRSMFQLLHSCEAIDHELRADNRTAWMTLGAHLTLIAVEVWRMSGVEEIALGTQSDPSSILQRFRQLVEVNFQRHWTIHTYANQLGISTDRLHSICTRKIGRKPLQLVHERLAHECKLLLERSSLTVEQIAHALGFKDAAHFSHFFKRWTSQPPGRYRKQVHSQSSERPAGHPESFADWP